MQLYLHLSVYQITLIIKNMFMFKRLCVLSVLLGIVVFSTNAYSQSLGRLEMLPKGHLINNNSLIYKNKFRIYAGMLTANGEIDYKDNTEGKSRTQRTFLGGDIPVSEARSDYFSLGQTNNSNRTKYNIPETSTTYPYTSISKSNSQSRNLQYLFFPIETFLIGLGIRDYSVRFQRNVDVPANGFTSESKVNHNYQSYDVRGIATIQDAFRLGFEFSPEVSVKNDYTGDSNAEDKAGQGRYIQLGGGYFKPSFSIALDISQEAENKDAEVPEQNDLMLSGEYLIDDLSIFGENGISKWSFFSSYFTERVEKVDTDDLIIVPRSRYSFSLGTSVLVFTNTVVSLNLFQGSTNYEDTGNDSVDSRRADRYTSVGQSLSITGNF